MNINDRAKNLATLILTNSDRITKQMRQEAFQLLEDIRGGESDLDIDTGTGHLRVSKVRLATYLGLVRAELYIDAIKQARIDYGIGLREAKFLIDAIRTRSGV